MINGKSLVDRFLEETFKSANLNCENQILSYLLFHIREFYIGILVWIIIVLGLKLLSFILLDNVIWSFKPVQYVLETQFTQLYNFSKHYFFLELSLQNFVV